MKHRLLIIAALATTAPATAQAPDTSGPRLQVAAWFNDVTLRTSTVPERPVLVHTPSLAELDRTYPDRPEEFGLAFNCAVSRSGTLSDCHHLYKAPDKNGADALTKALAPLIRLSPASAASALHNDYRVTINAAREIIIADGMPRTCGPPFCMVEGLRPPPPPPEPRDPALHDAMARARQCQDGAWEKARLLWIAAETSLRTQPTSPPTEQTRSDVLAFVRARQAVMACATDLESATSRLQLDAQDRAMAAELLSGMKNSYFGQTQNEMVVLLGLLDRDVAKTERTFYYPLLH
jgi:hypothetical protein